MRHCEKKATIQLLINVNGPFTIFYVKLVEHPKSSSDISITSNTAGTTFKMIHKCVLSKLKVIASFIAYIKTLQFATILLLVTSFFSSEAVNQSDTGSKRKAPPILYAVNTIYSDILHAARAEKNAPQKCTQQRKEKKSYSALSQLSVQGLSELSLIIVCLLRLLVQELLVLYFIPVFGGRFHFLQLLSQLPIVSWLSVLTASLFVFSASQLLMSSLLKAKKNQSKAIEPQGLKDDP